jgi:Leucine-rich repeat (LRR) protein
LAEISELSKFPLLLNVDISQNPELENVERALTDLVHLACLDMSGDCLYTVPMLRARALAELRISDNYIQELENVQLHHYLRVLECSNNQLSTLEELSSLRNLTFLDVSNNAIRSLRGLDGLPLTELHISNNALRSFDDAPSLPFLKFLDVSTNFIEDLRGLSRYSLLSVLRACDNHIASLQSLHSLDSLRLLRELNLNGNEVQKSPRYRLEVLFV